jgi:small-conductance mechanosensitive channel
MTRVIPSLQRLVFYLTITLILTIVILFVFHQFIAEPISFSKLFEQAIDVIIIILAWFAAVVIIRRFKPYMAQRVGEQASTIVQYVILAITTLILMFYLLVTIHVSATELLTGAGIISITAGLVISTFVGSILSGFLVFTNYKYRVGDNVMINNVPGKVTEMTALIMRIQTDVGQITIPNSAIASGGVIITCIRDFEVLKESRLHYKLGDRVVSSFMNEQGIIRQITPYYTIIQLDSGKEITLLNNSILSGAVVIAKITEASEAETKNQQHSIN